MTSTHYFISAGETSGDLLGAELVQELRKRVPELRAFGIAGPGMRAQGVTPLASIEDLAVMGFVEVIRHLPRIKAIESEVLARIDRLRPRFAVLIDYPGFHLRLAEQLKMRGIPVYQYVAPQMWAWGEKRAQKLREVTDGVLGIMPFEESFFLKHGINFRYVGTPQVDRVKTAERDRSKLGLPEGRPIMGFFPGSRASEVSRTLPVMRRIIAQVKILMPDVLCLVSAAPSLPLELFQTMLGTDIAFDELGPAAEGLALGRHILVTRHRSLDLMAVSDAALVTSGTATLECALLRTPMAVMYVLNPISYFMAQRMVRLPYISLVNLVAGKRIVDEYVQNIDSLALARHLTSLIADSDVRKNIITELSALNARLKGKPAEQAGAWIAATLT